MPAKYFKKAQHILSPIKVLSKLMLNPEHVKSKRKHICMCRMSGCVNLSDEVNPCTNGAISGVLTTDIKQEP